MTDLLLQPMLARGPNDYDVIADDWIVGRIVLSDASPAERPWLWSLDHEFYQGREQTHGYEATREAAMQALARAGLREHDPWVAPRRAKPGGRTMIRLSLSACLVSLVVWAAAAQQPVPKPGFTRNGTGFCVVA